MLPKLSTYRHISRFHAAPPNPDFILREATVHQRQEWLQVTGDGLRQEDSHGAALERINAQGSQESRVALTGGTEREIKIAVIGVTGNTHTCPKSVVYYLRPLLGVGKSRFIREVSGISDIVLKRGLYSCNYVPRRRFRLKLTEIRY